MKALGIISTAALFLFLGATVSSYAQDEHHDQDSKPEKQQDAKPAQHEEQTKPAQEEKQTKPVKPEDQAKTEKQEEPAKQDAQPKPAKDAKPAKAVKQQEQEHAKTEKSAPENKQTAREGDAKSAPQHAQRTASEQKKQNAVPALRLSVSGEGRIPDARFHANFGQGHPFRIGSPRIVDGYSRFQYGGFWFGFVQPWPDGWYYTDNVYVDYVDGGYYLYNPYYPGVRMSICVVL